MKLTYDPRYNVAYLRLHEKTGAVNTLHLSDEINAGGAHIALFAMCANDLPLHSSSEHGIEPMDRLLRDRREGILKVAASHGAPNGGLFGAARRSRAGERCGPAPKASPRPQAA